MYVIDEEDLSEDLIEHYGTKGMRWGVRRGKSVTGIGRARGAIIDRNDVALSKFKNQQLTLKDRSGATRGQKFVDTTNRMLMGRKRTEKWYQKRVDQMESQNARLKSGKLKLRDRLEIASISTMPINMLLSARPK